MMSKKRKTKHKKRKQTEDFGTCSFYCKPCNYTFEIAWQTIWDIQEMTHGYVGFHTTDTYISCPKCERIIDENDEVDPFNDDPLFK
ncbi:hypothetical protein RRV45_20090 [Bacillus sp. DTU_2020_1000418_1_SI_GHA_SEK_038]|uniref:hypothetical protein n=1 Tax=Bacillus sp. DTU_2020_1000418_1_SI_GHA_SEK_038 TaxID=3077585 RepID=UPI0028E42634|nr:hypothetical protein [Bacillus sp. DTU_2020_1000418_1_SI_GHA_SEK_038]WNS75151.1 hypothetical protein RRV45_20090 [Bacillus sp. DTU_2020_1000418_1_SI_GHA_SEK_038]